MIKSKNKINNKTSFLVKIYNSYPKNGKITIKKELEENSFNNIEDCTDYYFKLYPYNSVDISPIKK